MTSGKYPEPTESRPSNQELEFMVYDGVALATDGCTVELDGECEHGYPSWFLYLDLV